MAGDIKHMSISDDFLSKQAQAQSEELSAEDATHKSFMEKRHRHSSVPQTVKPTGPAQGSGGGAKPRRHIPPGKLMSVRLNKSQIDKASKDKSGKFSEHFNVTLFLVRPNDQTLQAEFSRSNLVCQGAEPAGAEESSEESSEDECGGVEMRSRAHAQGQQARVQSTVVRTLTSPLPGPNTIAQETHSASQKSHGSQQQQQQQRAHGAHGNHGSHGTHTHGMVRNSTEPGSTPRMAVSMAVTSQSTWI